jgi:uncharacterized protein YqeY
MAALKTQFKTDLVVALKAHDELRKSTLRMALAAIANEEVAGKQARELTDAQELAVVAKEVAKRKDSAEAYRAGHRAELAEKEMAEAAILEEYLPAQLDQADVESIVAEEIAAATAREGALSMRHMGAVMKSVNARVAGRFEGARVAALVKAALG